MSGGGDGALVSRLARLNVEAAERSDVNPAQVLIVDDVRPSDRSIAGRPVVVGLHYAAHADDRALLLYLLARYAERAEPRGSNRRKSVRISFVVAVIVAAVVAVGINSNHLGLRSGLVLLVVVAAALYIPTVLVDARLSREFVERVDFLAAFRFGPGAVEPLQRDHRLPPRLRARRDAPRALGCVQQRAVRGATPWDDRRRRARGDRRPSRRVTARAHVGCAHSIDVEYTFHTRPV